MLKRVHTEGKTRGGLRQLVERGDLKFSGGSNVRYGFESHGPYQNPSTGSSPVLGTKYQQKLKNHRLRAGYARSSPKASVLGSTPR